MPSLPSKADLLRQRNFEALEAHHPGLAARLMAPANVAGLTLHQSADGLRAFDGHYPLGLLDAPPTAFDPSAVAAGQTAVLAGIGDGALAERLLRETNANVVVVETAVDFLFEVLGRWPWPHHLRRGRLKLAVPPVTRDLGQDEAEASAVLDASLGSPKRILLPANAWWLRLLTGELAAPDEYAGLVLRLQREPEFAAFNWRDRLSLLGQREETSKLRLWAASSIHTSATKTLLAAFARAMPEGSELRVRVESGKPDEHLGRLPDLLQSGAEWLLGVTYPPRSLLGLLGSLLKRPSALILNLPPSVLDAQKLSMLRPEDMVLSVEERDWPAQLGRPDAEYLPLASTYADFAAAEPDGQRLAFLGNIADDDLGSLASLSNAEWEAVTEVFWRHYPATDQGRLSRLLEEGAALRCLQGVRLVPQALWGTVYRVSALAALDGLPLDLYGSPAWLPFLEAGRIQGSYCGHPEPVRELPAAMARYLVNINLCGSLGNHAINMRTWDATGLGTCVLHDLRAEAQRYFRDGEHLVYFRDRSELRSKAEWLIANPDEARRIGRNARKLVLESHTYRHRAQTLVQALQQASERR